VTISIALLACSVARALPEGAIGQLGYGRPEGVQFSPDGRFLAVATSVGVELWDPQTQERVHFFETNRWMASPSFSSDGSMLASGGRGVATVWNVTTGQEVAVLRHRLGFSTVALSPDGATLATGDQLGAVRLWDISAQRQITNLNARRIEGLSIRRRIASAFDDVPMGINSVAFSPDRTTLAWGSFDGVVVWDVNRREAVTGFSPDRVGWARAAVFSPDGETLATLIYDGDVELWNINTRRKLAVLRWPLSTRSSFDNGGHGVSPIAFSPDGATLANSKGDTVMLWDVEARQAHGPLEGHLSMVRNLAFSPDGAMLATSSRDNTVKLWDVAERTEITTLRGHSSRVASVAFSPDGATLASGGGGSGGRTVKLWDVAAQRQIATLQGHMSLVHSVAFSPDGATLATGSQDRTVKLWDVAACQEIVTLPGFGSDATSVAFSPDGDTLAVATSSRDGTVKLLDVVTRQEIAALTAHSGPIHSLAFSPSGGTLVTCGGQPAAVKLWDVKTGQETTSWQSQYGATSVAFSPGGATVASGTLPGANLWDVHTPQRSVSLWNALWGRQRHPTLEGDSYHVNAVAFSPDGTLLAGADTPTRLWDVRTRQTVATLPGHAARTEDVVFAPDGRTLASGSYDGTILLWRVPR
jgi:WD40 repeat protein